MKRRTNLEAIQTVFSRKLSSPGWQWNPYHCSHRSLLLISINLRGMFVEVEEQGINWRISRFRGLILERESIQTMFRHVWSSSHCEFSYLELGLSKNPILRRILWIRERIVGSRLRRIDSTKLKIKSKVSEIYMFAGLSQLLEKNVLDKGMLIYPMQ